MSPCVPVPLDPRTLPASELPARNITPARSAAFYRTQFAQCSEPDLLPNYPEAGEPRSRVASIGAERGSPGLFGADYVHQHWTDLDHA